LGGQITFEGDYNNTADQESAENQVCKYFDL